MKIGFIVNHVASAIGFENVVSGHVQIPLHTMRLLKRTGHTVQLITTEYGRNRSLPDCMPEGITIYQVVDGRRRGGGLAMEVGHKSGVRPLRLLKQIYHIKRILEYEQYDIVHLFGANRMAYLAGLIRAIGFTKPLILTLNSGTMPEKLWLATQFLWNKLSAVVTSTDFLGDKCKAQGLPTRVIRHGIVRNMLKDRRVVKADKPHRILFWRDPSWENGADICLEVFRHLAHRYPHVSFDFAVRPHWNPVAGLEALENRYKNVHIYRFPYRNGITIERLLFESICVLLPFRNLSINPQLAVLESMMSNTAVITSTLDSNYELIDSGKNGFLLPVGDVAGNLRAVECLLTDPSAAKAMGVRAALTVEQKWNWDLYLSELIGTYEDIIETL